MKRVNLHSHSIYSDGDDTPEEVVALALKEGVELLSLTDHNTFEGYPRFEKACREAGLQYVKGVEIDFLQPNLNFFQELLAYFPNGGEECLDDVLRHKRQARTDRLRRAVERASAHYGVELTIEELERRAVAEKGFVGMISNQLFRRYLGEVVADTSDYDTVKKEFWKREASDTAYSLYELIEIVSRGGGFPVLAHVGNHFHVNPELMRENAAEFVEALRYMKSIGLWGVELHPYKFHHRSEEVNSIVRGWAEEVGLQLTTGSDYHGAEQASYKIYEDLGFEFEGFNDIYNQK